VDGLVQQFSLLRQPLLATLKQHAQAANNYNNTVYNANAAETNEAKGQHHSRRSSRRKAKGNAIYEEDNSMEEEDEPDELKQAAAPIVLAAAPALPQELDQRRAKRAKPHYKSLKKKDLKEKCQQEGLPTHGTEKELEKRHAGFLDKCNAECDSLYPRPIAEIRKEYVQEEQERASAKFSGPVALYSKCLAKIDAQLSLLGNAEKNWTEIPSSGDANFDALLNGLFDQMLRKHWERYPNDGKSRRSWSEIEASMTNEMAFGEVAANNEPPNDEAADEEEPAAAGGKEEENPPPLDPPAANEQPARLPTAALENPYLRKKEPAAASAKPPVQLPPTGQQNPVVPPPLENPYASASLKPAPCVAASATSAAAQKPPPAAASLKPAPQPTINSYNQQVRHSNGSASSTETSSGPLSATNNQPQRQFLGLQQAPSAKQSAPNEKSRPAAGRPTASSGTKSNKRKSPKQSTLANVFKPVAESKKKQRSSSDENSNKKLSETGSILNWTCTRCTALNEKNPGDYARCQMCCSCRACQVQDCSCRRTSTSGSQPSSSQETICIDC